MTAKLITLPDRDIRDIPRALRDLADSIEAGKYGRAYNLAWVMDCGDKRIEVGLLGASPKPAPTAYFMLGLGMRRIEP